MAQPQSVTPREEAYRVTAEGVNAFNRGHYVTAQDRFEKALMIEDTIPEPHFWLARVHARNAGSDPEAREQGIVHFKRALELNPYGAMGDLLRSWLYKLMGRPRHLLVLPVSRPAGSRPDEPIDFYRTDELLNHLDGKPASTY